MGGLTERPPIWLLPRPLGGLPALRAGHPRLALILAATGLVGLAPAFAFLAPASRWDPQAVLILLVLFSFYAYVGAAHLRDTATLDATFVAALLGVVLLGPLAGALVFAAPEFTRLASDRRLTSMTANLASFGWACLAAAWTLEALGYGSPAELGAVSSYIAVVIAGLALILVNYFYITVISAVVKDGMDLTVAHAWAALTAQGGPGLAPQQALVNLRTQAGQELDPVVVAAAVKTVDEIIELGTTDARPAPAAIAT